MDYYAIVTTESLEHHGIKGQRWGVRRYQNEDGSYKSGAEGRYDSETTSDLKKQLKETKNNYKLVKAKYKTDKKIEKLTKKQEKKEQNKTEKDKLSNETKKKIALASGAAIAASALTIYGGYKISKFIKEKGASIAAQKAMEWYKNNSDGDANAFGLSAYNMAKNRMNTKTASKEILDYLGTGKRLSEVTKPTSYGYVDNSTKSKIKKAVSAQAGRTFDDVKNKIKNTNNKLSTNNVVSDKIQNKISESINKNSETVGNVVENKVKELSKKALNSAVNQSKKTLKTIGNESVKIVKNTVSKTTKTAADAAVTTTSAIAITKLAQAMPDNTGDEKKDKINKIVRQSAEESIRTASNNVKQSYGGKNNGNYSNKGNNNGNKITSSIGSPTNKGIDKSSEEYRDLFNNVSPDVKSTLKTMSNQGYDIEQLKMYKRQNT